MDELLRSQRADVFEMIQKMGMDPKEFSWKRSSEGRSRTLRPTLVHGSSKSFFVFDEISEKHACTFSPGKEMVLQSEYPGSWTSLRSYFSTWLTNLRRELDVGDPWDAARALPVDDHGALLTSGENTKFSPEELKVLHQKLDRVGAELRQAQIGTEAERKLLISVLADAKESSTRLGKKDWKAALLGAFMGTVMSGAVSTETMRAAWGFLQHAFDAAQKLLGS